MLTATDLLEYLQKKTGCLYLSDLHTPEVRERALAEALLLKKERFPLSQWREAARYLLESAAEDATMEEIRAQFKAAAENK